MVDVDELRSFLRSRRSRLTPSDVGQPASSGVRRVRGLRREEVALAAGISPDYYARLEQGRIGNVSDQVIDALARALVLDDVEREHLRRLTRLSSSERVSSASRSVSGDVRSMIVALDPTPALLHTAGLDVLVVNRMAGVLLTGLRDLPDEDRNLARWVFLHPGARSCMRDWAATAKSMASALRTAAIERSDPQTRLLIDELTRRSSEFTAFWDDHHLARPAAFWKPFRHDVVGDLDLRYQSLQIPQHPDLYVALYTPRPGTTSAGNLGRLAALTPGALVSTEGG